MMSSGNRFVELISRARRSFSIAVVLATLCVSDSLSAFQGQRDAGERGLTTTPANAGVPNAPAGAGATNAVTTPPVDAKPLSAVAIDVVGTVDFAPAGVSVLASDGWKPVKVETRLDSGTQIRTGLRSSVNLKFGETTICSIRAATHASIDQIYRSATAEVVRLGLGYGTIRGGSSEGSIRADVSVDSTVATLAKRGTEGWQIQVEPSTGRFNISLAQYGLVEAIQKLGAARAASRSVRPGEYATERNIANMWVNQDIFDRNVTFFDAEGLTSNDVASMTAQNRGYEVMTPGAGTAVVDASARVDAGWVMDQIEARTPAGVRPPTTMVIQPGGPIGRPEGNFGTGSSFRVLVPRNVAGRVTPRGATVRRR